MNFPIFIKESKVPVWLSKIAPIDIGAISFGLWVWSRPGYVIDDELIRHETIHYKQQLELLFVFQWILYGFFWFFGVIRYRDGAMAYYNSPFEREAYENEHNENYLEKRPFWAWRKYL